MVFLSFLVMVRRSRATAARAACAHSHAPGAVPAPARHTGTDQGKHPPGRRAFDPLSRYNLKSRLCRVPAEGRGENNAASPLRVGREPVIHVRNRDMRDS